MFVPAPFQVEDLGAITAVIDRHALATAVSRGEPVPHVTHLPAIRAPEPDDDVHSLVGTRLLGHMNRNNPHWRSLSTGDAVLLVFHGPSGYITPSIYRCPHPAAPTWDFVAVHVRGRVRLLEPGEPTLEVVCRTVDRLESTVGSRWEMADSMQYFRRIVGAVGAFEVRVEGVDSQFKLSQDLDAENRRRVCDDLAARSGPAPGGLVEVMRGRMAP